MNLREQIEKEITEKVMTKLASERVELFGAKDIAKMTAQVEKGQNVVDAKLKEFKAAKDEFAKAKAKAVKVRATAVKSEAEATKIIGQADYLIDRVMNISEDLGVSPNDVKGLNNLIKINRNLERNADSLIDFDFNLE